MTKRQEMWVPQVKGVITHTTKTIELYTDLREKEQRAQERYETRDILDPKNAVIINWQEAMSDLHWQQEEEKAVVRVAHIERLGNLIEQLQVELNTQYEIVEAHVLDLLLLGPTLKIPAALSLLYWCDELSIERRAYCSQFGLRFLYHPSDETRPFPLGDQDIRQSVCSRLLGLQPAKKARDLNADAHHTTLWLSVDYYTALFLDALSVHQTSL